MGQQKREKINRPEHTAGHSQNKGSEQVLRRILRLWSGPALPEAGGSGEGKGAGSPPRTASPTALQTGLQFLTKAFLRFWMVDIRRDERHRAHTTDLRGRGLRLGPQRGEGAVHPGRARPSSSWLPELLGPAKAQNAGAAESALVWSTRGLEPRAAQGTLHIEQPGA